MQDYKVIPQESIKRSRAVIENNMATIASNFSGTAFPTIGLQVGMKCYRVDLEKTYTLKNISPLKWEDDASSGVFAAEADVANKATADRFGRKLEETYVLVSTRGKPQGVATLDESGKVPVGQLRMQEDVATRRYVRQQVQTAVDALPKVAPQADKANKDGIGRDIAGTYTPKDGAGAYGTWNINVTGRATSAGAADSAAMATRAASADRAAMADKATMADKAGWANEANLALNIPTYDRGGNIWIA
jgi:hypothetical protein